MARAAQPPEPPVLRRPPALPEPPSVDAAKAPLPPGPASPPAPPPQIQAEEKPKLAFETPGRLSPPPNSSGLAPRLQPPGSSVMEAARAAVRGGRGGVIVGDQDLAGSAGIGGGLLQAPAPGRTATALEMISDPAGVDFKPYLIRILAAVKRNWLAVIPESARLGRAGRVAIEFAINRDGHVPKLVIAMPSGTDALDRAAVAGISASNPFPPLPSEFRGDQIRLQFTFSYNLR
jgi:TonB family protein